MKCNIARFDDELMMNNLRRRVASARLAFIAMLSLGVIVSSVKLSGAADGDAKAGITDAAQAQVPNNPSECCHGNIVFQSDRSGHLQIYSANAKGTNTIRLTNDPFSDANPVFSHDGRMVAFISDRDGPNHIFLMNADGTGVERLTTELTADDNPGWSPDDTQIVYSAINLTAIGIINTDGTGHHVILQNSNLNAQPNWSPDGKKIVFNQNYEIAVMNANGTGVTVLTSLAGFTEWPHWSPNGQQIVFHSTQSGNYQIYVMNPDGTGITGVTNDGLTTDGRFGLQTVSL